jgi:hypothetical protein
MRIPFSFEFSEKSMSLYRSFGLVFPTFVLLALGMSTVRGDEPKGELRKWKDDSGKFEVTARYLGLEKDSVRLERENGKIVLVPLSRLSAADREIIQKLQPENPFEKEADASSSTNPAAEAVVLVSLQRGKAAQTVPGLVIRKEGDKVYVLADSPRFAVEGPQGMMGMPGAAGGAGGMPGMPGGMPTGESAEPLTATISWGPDDKRRKVKADLAVSLSGRGVTICRAAAAEMPPPLVRDKEIAVSEGMAVRAVGWDIDTMGATPAFARLAESGTLKKVYRDEDGKVTKMQVEGDSLASFRFGVFTTVRGEPIGVLLGGPNGVVSLKGVTASPLRLLAAAEEPQLRSISFSPSKGDEKTIEYLFAVSIDDPFGRVKSPQIFVKKLESLPSGFSRNAPAGQKAEKFAEDAVALKLAPGKIPEDVIGLRVIPGGTNLLAAHQVANPGPVENHLFTVQFAYTDAAGKEQFLSPTIVQFNATQARAQADLAARIARANNPTATVPSTAGLNKIPGIDGRPLDMPRVTPHKDGGYLLTSQVTRVKEQAKFRSELALPQPKKTGQDVAANRFTAGQMEGTALSYQTNPDDNRGRAVMTLSADGKWLYLVDGSYVLRKVSFDDYREDAVLSLGAKCNQIALSKAGLVVPLSGANTVWVVNADTLAVEREISVPEVQLVAASPATVVGIAYGRAAGDRIVSGGEYTIIDLSNGTFLHRLRRRYATREGFMELGGPRSQAIFEDSLLAMQMSPDGKYLYTGGRKIQRFRVDGEDLIYEEASRDLQNGHTTHFALSIDGKWTAMPTGGGNGDGSYGIAVFSAHELATPRLKIENGAYPCAIGFDPKTGNIYSPNHDSMQVFSPRGGRLHSFKLPGRGGWEDICRILVHPAGERFLTWDKGHVTIFDARKAKFDPVDNASEKKSGEK